MILIGTELEQALAAITCCCGLTIVWSVLEQIELDCKKNKCDAKQYCLHKSRYVCISATVDEYEPETVTLALIGQISAKFDAINTAASMPGFGQHPFYLDRPIDAPQLLVGSIESALRANFPNQSFAMFRVLAFHRLNAISRCFFATSKLIPTPYIVTSTNIRTMESRPLGQDESMPYEIKGYR